MLNYRLQIKEQVTHLMYLTTKKEIQHLVNHFEIYCSIFYIWNITPNHLLGDKEDN